MPPDDGSFDDSTGGPDDGSFDDGTGDPAAGDDSQVIDDQSQWPDDGPAADDAQGPDGPWPAEPEADGGQAQPDAGGEANSPAEIRRRLAGDSGSTSGRQRRDRAAGAGAGDDMVTGIDGFGAPVADGADTSGGVTPGAVTTDTTETTLLESLSVFGNESVEEEAIAPQTQPGEIDAAAPATENTASRRNRPGLWVTAIGIGSLLLISALWVWTRQRFYDPA